jgi:hypothetical protein
MCRADVLAAMRRGAILQPSIARPGIVWSLNNGAAVSHRTATAIIARPDIVSSGDGLFDDVVAQTYRYAKTRTVRP